METALQTFRSEWAAAATDRARADALADLAAELRRICDPKPLFEVFVEHWPQLVGLEHQLDCVGNLSGAFRDALAQRDPRGARVVKLRATLDHLDYYLDSSLDFGRNTDHVLEVYHEYDGDAEVQLQLLGVLVAYLHHCRCQDHVWAALVTLEPTLDATQWARVTQGLHRLYPSLLDDLLQMRVSEKLTPRFKLWVAQQAPADPNALSRVLIDAVIENQVDPLDWPEAPPLLVKLARYLQSDQPRRKKQA